MSRTMWPGCVTGAIASALAGCAVSDPGDAAGVMATVAAVVDGDTIELAGGERVRYLLVDTPESTGAVECFGPEAARFNRDLVLGKEVALTFDVEREDRFGRTLAYVAVDGVDVSAAILERGYGCVLFIAPNGVARKDELDELELRARTLGRGLWAACEPRPC